MSAQFYFDEALEATDEYGKPITGSTIQFEIYTSQKSGNPEVYLRTTDAYDKELNFKLTVQQIRALHEGIEEAGGSIGIIGQPAA